MSDECQRVPCNAAPSMPAAAATVRFTVPGRPVGVNATYERRGGRGRGLKLTPEAAAYRQRVQLYAVQALRGRRRPIFAGPCEVRLGMFFGSAQADVDGCVKPLLDALEGFVYADDVQVHRLLVEKTTDAERPRVEIAVGLLGEVLDEPRPVNGWDAHELAEARQPETAGKMEDQRA